MDATKLLNRFLTDEDVYEIGVSIANSYTACTDFMKLNVVTGSFPIGMEQRPHLLRAFVDHSLMRMADIRPGFTHQIRPNAANNCRHVCLFKNGLALTAHYMGTPPDFRYKARDAINRAFLANRNGNLFEFEDEEMDFGHDFGYAHILHGGSMKAEMLVMNFPTRDQHGVAASITLDIPSPDLIAVEQVVDEINMTLREETLRKANDS